ncbi:MAG TPA: zinc ribbon domain-containing protein [Candidatus Acidoferrum sp.]|jgi:putative FmdB family regulatory protein|nr:zinc ribbon domain-containing protein [Candidatus Acidoferrum sp.]
MPTYEYVCKKCGHEFEASRSMTAKPLQTCPKELCAKKKWGRGRVTKKISGGAGLLFKGTGFYITDYRSQKYKDAAKKDSSSTETKPAKTETKAASTPAPAAKSGKG